MKLGFNYEKEIILVDNLKANLKPSRFYFL